MGDTNPKELAKAIEIFKEKYGDKEPLDMFKLDEIIIQLRKEKK
jgi:hypothetical protein